MSERRRSVTRARHPNVLMIMADALRWDALGCNGNPVVRTPNIDRLAREGIRFTSAFTTNPFCAPARASFLTGRWPHAHGLWDNGVRISPETTTLATVLDEAGYRTGIVGKGHLDAHYNAPDSSDHVFGWDDPARAARMTGPHYFGFREQARTCAHSKAAGHYGAWLYREHPDAVPLLDKERALNDPVGDCWTSALPVELHSSTYVGDRAIRFLEPYDAREYSAGQRPFFLWMSFPDPHGPICPPLPYAEMYDPREIPPPPRRPGETRDKPPHFRGEVDSPYPDWQPYGAGQRASEARRDETDQIRRAYYYALVSLIDANVGRVIDALEQRGELDNTLVLFTSDHGNMMGDHWTDGYAIWHYDAAVRVPFIVRYPGFGEGGRVVDDLISVADFAPTVCDLAGVPYTAWPPRPDADPGGVPPPGALPDVQGRSFVPLLRGEGTGRDRVLIEYESRFNPGLQLKTLRTPRYRLTHYAGRPYGELYDLQEDPGEFTNRWGDPSLRGVRADLTAQLLDEVLRTESRLPPRVGPN